MFESMHMRVLLIVGVAAFFSWLAFPLKTKIHLGLDLRGGAHLEAQVDLQDLEKRSERGKLTELEKRDAVNQALIVVRERINQSGVAEAEVRLAGKDRILLQIPGFADKASAEKMLTQVGYLEFALTHEDPVKLALAQKNKKIPGYRLLSMKSGHAGESVSRPILVKEKPEFDGTQLRSAALDYDQNMGSPQVTLEFTGKGASMFAAVTRKNIQRQLAIILDGAVVSAPTIQTEIPDGRAVISGQFTLEEAKSLTLILNAGALPAKIKVLQSQIVSATLGKDSIDRGVKASIYGLIVVALFMIGYYLKSGVISILALVLNTIIILGAVSVCGVTMTLPGIAGLILTMGIAVDANVLINERIREELSLGKRIKAAVAAGYERAFWTIFDSHVTTFITSIALYNLGKGPIKGFALVLMIGLISSIFTAVFVSRTLSNILLSISSSQTFKMFSWVPKTSFKFIEWRRKAYFLSLVTMLICVIGFFAKGDKKYGIDFIGGSLLEIKYEKDVKIENIRSAFHSFGEEVSLQTFGASDRDFLIRSKIGNNEKIKEALTASNLGSFSVSREEEVGSVIGAELKGSSLWAFALSIFGIAVYIAFRFEGRYALGTIASLIHDLVVTAGLYCLLGFEMNVPTIAAILTILGYSLNDTVVVFDRIRETLRTRSRKTMVELIDDAINTTLSRTMLTSFTTLLSVACMLYGGGSVFEFAIALFIGVIVGTYSSVFIAAPILVEIDEWSKKQSTIKK
jgi:SecD/SecF fusion protein